MRLSIQHGCLDRQFYSSCCYPRGSFCRSPLTFKLWTWNKHLSFACLWEGKIGKSLSFVGRNVAIYLILAGTSDRVLPLINLFLWVPSLPVFSNFSSLLLDAVSDYLIDVIVQFQLALLADMFFHWAVKKVFFDAFKSIFRIKPRVSYLKTISLRANFLVEAANRWALRNRTDSGRESAFAAYKIIKFIEWLAVTPNPDTLLLSFPTGSGTAPRIHLPKAALEWSWT